MKVVVMQMMPTTRCITSDLEGTICWKSSGPELLHPLRGVSILAVNGNALQADAALLAEAEDRLLLDAAVVAIFPLERMTVGIVTMNAETVIALAARMTGIARWRMIVRMVVRMVPMVKTEKLPWTLLLPMMSWIPLSKEVT
jgi:predicted aconitase with swiveling domain